MEGPSRVVRCTSGLVEQLCCTEDYVAGNGQISKWLPPAPLHFCQGQVREDMRPGARRPGVGPVC